MYRSTSVVVAVALLASCGAEPAPAPQDTGAPTALDSALQIAFNTQLTLTDSGVVRGVLHADSTRIFPEGVHFELHGVQVTFIDSSGDTLSTLSAGSADYDVVAGNLDFRGGASLETVDGKSLRATSIVYSLSANALTPDSSYSLSDPAGAGMRGTRSFTPALEEAPTAAPMPAPAPPAGSVPPAPSAEPAAPLAPSTSAVRPAPIASSTSAVRPAPIASATSAARSASIASSTSAAPPAPPVSLASAVLPASVASTKSVTAKGSIGK